MSDGPTSQPSNSLTHAGAEWDRLSRKSNNNSTALLDWCRRAMNWHRSDVERLGGDWGVESKALPLVLAAFRQAVAARADAAIVQQLAVPPLPKTKLGPPLPTYAPMVATTGLLKLQAFAEWCRHARDAEPTAALGAGAGASDPKGDAGKKRSCYERDHTWLHWHEDEKLGPAKIRDRWNQMHPRKKIGVGASGRDLVKKALAKARAEKKSQ